MFKGHFWAWALGFAAILAALLLALLTPRPAPDSHQLMSQQKHNGAGAAAIPDTAPQVVAFSGDLAEKGIRQPDGKLVPFVAGEILTLEAQARNAVAYRWEVNGVILKEKDKEWSAKPDREFEVKEPGEYVFSLQAAGEGDDGYISEPKTAAIKVLPLFIESFEKAITEEEDRGLPNEPYSVEVNMAEPRFQTDPELYRFRYLVNGVPVKGSADDEEWTADTDFTYVFPSPGHYAFKVEARRAGSKVVEGSKDLEQVIVVADAVLLTFNAAPEKSAPLGMTVQLSAMPESLYGKSECRFGVKKITDSNYLWIPALDKAMWGSPHRDWLPTEAGTYVMRAEIREAGKPAIDDYRETLYTITEGNF